MISATKKEMLACVERELLMRRRVYPERVKLGKMSAGRAVDEVRVMEAVLAAIAKHVPDDPVVQPSLFGGPRR